MPGSGTRPHRTQADDIELWRAFVAREKDPVGFLAEKLACSRDDVRLHVFGFVYGGACLPLHIVDAIEKK